MTQKADSLRIPPHDIEAEMSVIGAAMLGDRYAIDQAAAILTRDDFYRDANAHIWDSILAIHDKKQPVDVVTLKDDLSRRGILEQIGGLDYLMRLGEVAFTTANIAHYARIVRDRAGSRSVIAVATESATRAYSGELYSDLISDMEAKVLGLRKRGEGAGSWTHVKVAAKEALEQLYERYEAGGAIPGICSSWEALDRITLGLRDTYLYILAARPGMGKTQAALQICADAALGQGKSVGVVSLEMSKASLIDRIACTLCYIDMHRYSKGQLSQDEFQRINSVVSSLWESSIHIDDNTGQTVNDIRIRARRLQAEHGLDLLIIDHLHLIRHDGKGSENRSQWLGDIAQSLHDLARDLEIPVVALAQLNRSVEKREDKRPVLSDLAESGGVEAAADVVAFIYRAAYYDQGAPSNEAQGAEIIVAKHRNGPRGTAHLQFKPWCVRFEDVPRIPEHGTPGGMF